jgi:small-conductance mechanosensitive channel
MRAIVISVATGSVDARTTSPAGQIRDRPVPFAADDRVYHAELGPRHGLLHLAQGAATVLLVTGWRYITHGYGYLGRPFRCNHLSSGATIESVSGILQIVGNGHTVQLFGIPLVGISLDTAKKLLFTLVFLLAVWVIRRAVRFLTNSLGGQRSERTRFWSMQAVGLITACVVLVGILSIWFNNPARLASAAGFVTAGLAFALQRVITAFAGYVIILRGRTFNVGDRIVMGGVRGDVIALGFMQTTIMEMGEPPAAQADAPAIWVRARQYTGRIAILTNDKIFDEPVYNYTREFPYIWEEMHLPIPYNADHRKAEQIILDAARRHTLQTTGMAEEDLKELERRYTIKRHEMEPRVYFRLTDNWVEMSVRFLAQDFGIRAVKDAMSRDILEGLDRARIGIASSTYDVVGMPELRVRFTGENGADRPARGSGDHAVGPSA